MDWAELVKVYVEIGILGLCGVLTVMIGYLGFKRAQEDKKNKDNRLEKNQDKSDNRFDSMLKLIQEQNRVFQEQQLKNNEMLINSIVQGVTNHVPSSEENTKLTRITEEIDKTLQQMLIFTNADRVDLVQYHNGGKGVNKQSFLKMSMTNEQVKIGVKPFMSEFKDQFRSVISYITKSLNEKGYCYINDAEVVKTVDPGTYEFLINRGIEAKYCMAIHDTKDNFVIGFVCVEYIKKEDAKPDLVDQVFKEKQKILETLLNL